MKPCVALLIFLAVWLTPALLFAQPFTIRVIVNGETMPQGAVEVVDQKVYVAVRPVGQALGADVSMSGKTVTITTLLRQVILHLDDPWATVNTEHVRLSDPPRRSGARVVLPLRSLGDAFGATVAYDSQSHTAVVSAASQSAPSGRPATSPPVTAARTLTGSVTAVDGSAVPPKISVHADGANYSIAVPDGAKIAFRDVHGAVTGNGTLSQVRPGDALIITLDSNGQLISMADIFASFNGTIASVANQSMVLTSGRVISADPKIVTVTLDGNPTTFARLAAGDKVSVRADPRSGQVREVVALTPGGYAVSASPTPGAGAPSSGGALTIARVSDNATAAFRAGGVLKISADGTPGARAQFDLSDIIVDNPMRETRTGHYEGQYLVTVGTNLTDAPVLVRLTKDGQTALAEATDPLTILTTPPSVKEIAPGQNARINTARPNIFATFITVGNKGMDPASLHMTLDGRDVTSRATRTASFVSYYPPANLASGTVKVEVKGTDIAGNALDYQWSFVILGQ